MFLISVKINTKLPGMSVLTDSPTIRLILSSQPDIYLLFAPPCLKSHLRSDHFCLHFGSVLSVLKVSLILSEMACQTFIENRNTIY